MTYEDIRKANANLSTMDIKGKDYVLVNERIKAFRMLYPEGFITTEIVSNVDGVCVMRARVGYYANGGTVVLGTGTAYEREDSTYINKTSYIENCETSAVGRALGMLALGVDTSVASAEEVQNDVNNQPKAEVKETRQPELITPVTVQEITVLAEKAQVPISEVLKAAKISRLEDMTAPCAEKMKATLKRTITKRAREAKNGTAGQTA
ncbi:MAG: hypothetical protein IJJ80_04955 [Clostridia bacterium]|nr:hypothetical protein [Clostridia bacterium]